MRFRLALVANLALTCALPTKRPDVIDAENPLGYTDMFYGAEGGGHMFPGSSRPFSMAKLGIDTYVQNGEEPFAGYSKDGKVTGISMLHESGTGGSPQYGVVSQLPFTGDFLTDMFLIRETNNAAVGYYQFNTTDGISVELASAERSGLIGYSFPDKASIFVDLSHHLLARRGDWKHKFVNGSASVSPNLSGYEGVAFYDGGWGEHLPWAIYFCSEFSQNATLVSSLENGALAINQTYVATNVTNAQIGLVFAWDTPEVTSKLGISHVSIDKACANMRNELPDFDIDSLVQETQTIWLNEVFERITVADDNATLTGWIYDALYGCHLMPTNKTGENPDFRELDSASDSVYYDDWYAIWDTFRSLNPLMNIINPTRGTEFIQALIGIFKRDGYTPDGRSANQNGRTQGGSNSDIVMADAYLKNIGNGSINWEDAYAAMVKNAEVVPPHERIDPMAKDSSTFEGRGALPDWLTYGYITRNFTRSVSRTVDYSYDDFALSVVAEGLGKLEDAEKYLNRSAYWQNIWNFEASHHEYPYTGFLQPRNADGQFNYDNYDPFSCHGCYWGDDEYEGKPVEYGWSVPHDIQTLITFVGGKRIFIERLNDMYELYGKHQVVDVGNEPSFLTPFLYNFVNELYRSVELIRWIVNRYFHSGPEGLPGNSDAGEMQSWLLFCIMGFYPISGTTTYLLSSPFVRSLTLNLDNGKFLTITANGLSQESYYVKSVKINGEPHLQNWVDHDTLFPNGGTIEFELTDEPTVWEQGTVPPSPGHRTLVTPKK